MQHLVLQQKVEEFFARFEYKKYKKGETIMHPDETNAKAYYVKSGYVRNYNLTDEGIEFTLHIYAPHSYFPMTSVISDVENRYYYEALIDTEVYIAPKAEVTAFLKSNPDVLFDLTSRLLNGLDKFMMRAEYLALKSASKRLVSTSLFLARHFGEKENNTCRFKYNFTHRDLASIAGVSRETASREWEKLLKSGLVSTNRQRIMLHDLEKLKNIAEE